MAGGDAKLPDHSGTAGSSATIGALSLHGVTKLYGELQAVDNVDLEVKPGEFVTLLGPSGSGKTTLLRMVAGFIAPDHGRMTLDGEDLSAIPPHKRNIGMVFQNYALFPHMTAFQNIAFPLQMRGISRPEIKQRVHDALELVRLEGLGDRLPRQLSGGQQQRVALARAVVFNPGLLLMDEPLGALDKKLREALQLEIVRISRRLGVTVIYVTHDQDEALVMSDRIAILDRGRIRQLGTSDELYERPASLFVADFMGESNILEGILTVEGDAAFVDTECGRVSVTLDAFRSGAASPGASTVVLVRPERINISPIDFPVAETTQEELGATLGGVVQEASYLGSMRKYSISLHGGMTIQARVHAGQPHDSLPLGCEVKVSWKRVDGIVIPASDQS